MWKKYIKMILNYFWFSSDVVQNTFGAKPLNVGEREFVDCLRTTGNRSQCERVAQKAVKQYRKTGKY